MKHLTYVLAGLCMCSVFIGVYLIPDRVSLFSLSYTEFFSGEFWRLGTYQFTHLTIGHLVANIVGIALVFYIGKELNVNLKRLLPLYFLTGLLSSLPIWAATQITVLGASAAVYGGLYCVSLRLNRIHLKPHYGVLLLVFAALIGPAIAFLKGGETLHAIYQTQQGLLHLSGMLTGALLLAIDKRLTRLRNVKKHGVLRTVPRA